MSDETKDTGTPEQAAQGAGTGSDGSEGLNDQQKSEYMTLKRKAEEYNKLEREKRELEQRLANMEQIAYGGGARQATDPRAELLSQLQEQSQFDPASKAALWALQRAEVANAEMWLSGQLSSVPESKRERVAALVRSYNYQIGVPDALAMVTDPDADATKQRLAELEAENRRLKERAVLPNGSSPASTAPASMTGATTEETVPWSDVLRTYKQGGAAALALRNKVDTKAVRVDYSK
jgi:hypothetical protein